MIGIYLDLIKDFNMYYLVYFIFYLNIFNLFNFLEGKFLLCFKCFYNKDKYVLFYDRL